VPRDDLLPGLRVTHYRQRAVIAYLVEVVSLVGVFYGGQAWEPSFTDSTEHDQ
jgi:hypothetical protein